MSQFKLPHLGKLEKTEIFYLFLEGQQKEQKDTLM